MLGNPPNPRFGSIAIQRIHRIHSSASWWVTPDDRLFQQRWREQVPRLRQEGYAMTDLDARVSKTGDFYRDTWPARPGALVVRAYRKMVGR